MEFQSPFSQYLDTNYVPSPPELVQIERLIEEQRGIADAIDAEIAELMMKRRSCNDSITKHYALTTPARGIPEDILSNIFLEMLALSKPHSSPHPAVTASHVCHRWRVLALSMPLLWMAIEVDVPMDRIWARCRLNVEEPSFHQNPEALPLDFIARSSHHIKIEAERMTIFLQRSGTCPLTLSVLARDLDTSAGAIINSEYFTPCRTMLAPIVEAARMFRQRHWTEFTLNLCISSVLSMILSFLSFPKTIVGQTLATGTLIITPAKPDRGFPFGFWEKCGEKMKLREVPLTSLTARVAHEDMARIDVDYGRLTDLSFGSPARHIEFLSTHALDILGRTSNLVNCSIHFSIHIPRRPVWADDVPLIHLQSLTISGDCPPIDFSSALHLPSLTRLSTANVNFYPEDKESSALVALVEGHGHQLEEVAIAYSALTEPALVYVLEQLPNVTSLHLTRNRIPSNRYRGSSDPPPPTPAEVNPHILSLLTPGREEGLCCPKLERLLLELVDGKEDGVKEALLDLIEKRRGVDASHDGPERRLGQVDVALLDIPADDMLTELVNRGVDTNGIVFRSA